jgi:hypothetical protein
MLFAELIPAIKTHVKRFGLNNWAKKQGCKQFMTKTHSLQRFQTLSLLFLQFSSGAQADMTSKSRQEGNESFNN